MPEFLRFEMTVTDFGPHDALYDVSARVVSHFIGLDGMSVNRLAQAEALRLRVKGHYVEVTRRELAPVEVAMLKPNGELL